MNDFVNEMATIERYYKVGEKVYREWSIDERLWVVELTAYTEIPWTIVDLSNVPVTVTQGTTAGCTADAIERSNAWDEEQKLISDAKRVSGQNKRINWKEHAERLSKVPGFFDPDFEC